MRRDVLSVLGCVLALGTGCGAPDRELDLEALTARDLLELSPKVAQAWTADDRAEARALFAAAGAGTDVLSAPRGLRVSGDDGEAIFASLLDIDARRVAAGRDALITGRVEIGSATVGITPVAPPLYAESSTLEVSITKPPPAGEVDARDLAVLGELALRAGHDPASGPVWVGWVEREPFAALYVAKRRQIWVNPNYLAALEPAESRASPTALERDEPPSRGGGPAVHDAPVVGADFEGNPYSFYGSVAECAAAERNRCEACLAAASCEPTTRDAESGAAECDRLAEDGGRGFHLLCANLALAMATVSDCVADSSASCVANRDAGNLLAALDANASFVDDPSCGGALDVCLADIFGEPDGDFPGPMPDAGVPDDPPQPPRDVDVACSDNSADCDMSPDFGCSTGGCSSAVSCGSCDSGCDSDDGSGTSSGGGCEAPGCEGGGCDSSGCGGCGSDGDDGGGGGGDGGGCGGGGDSGGGDSGGSCGGGGGSCGGSGGGGSCGGSSSGGGSSCGSSSGGGGGGSCTVAIPRRAAGPWVWAMLWVIAPIPLGQRLRRRERRRRERREREVTP